jgi:hypothetical protein
VDGISRDARAAASMKATAVGATPGVPGMNGSESEVILDGEYLQGLSGARSEWPRARWLVIWRMRSVIVDERMEHTASELDTNTRC